MVDGVCTDQLKITVGFHPLSVYMYITGGRDTQSYEEEGSTGREDKVLQHELTTRERKLIEFYY